MKKIIPYVVVVSAALLACGPKPRIPFDPSVVPSGQGWQCFAHNEPGLVDLGACFRTEAQCYAEKKDGGNSSEQCAPAEKAYCMYIDPSKPMCFPRQASCDEYFRQYGAGYSMSECKEIP